MERQETNHEEARAVIDALKGLWDKHEQMSDLQRVAANSFALGLQAGRKLNEKRGDKNHDGRRTGR